MLYLYNNLNIKLTGIMLIRDRNSFNYIYIYIYIYEQELSLKRLVGRVDDINTTLDFIFQYLVIHCKINPGTNSRLYKIV